MNEIKDDGSLNFLAIPREENGQNTVIQNIY